MCCEGMVFRARVQCAERGGGSPGGRADREAARTLRGIAIDESWNLGSILTRPAVAEMERHNRELVRTRNYIRKKRRKSDFERAVSGSFAIFYEQAQEAAGGLKAQIEQDGEPGKLFVSRGSEPASYFIGRRK